MAYRVQEGTQSEPPRAPGRGTPRARRMQARKEWPMSLVQIYLSVNVDFQGFISRVDPTTKQESHVAYLRGATTIHSAEPGTEWRFSIPEAESYITTDAPVQKCG